MDARCALFLLINHFLNRFSIFSEKNEGNQSISSLNFFSKINRIPFFLAHHLSMRQFQMLLEELRFVKTSASFGSQY